MKFKLTSSQMNFYNKNFTLDEQIWNQGVMQTFPKVYSYEQINKAYNKLVEIHDSLRVKLVETEDGVVADVKEHEFINYRFWQVETEEELMRKAQDFLNEPTDRYGLLVDCAVFQTPTTSGIMINAHHIVVDGYSVFVMAEHINNLLKDEDFAPVIQKYVDYIEKEEKYKNSRRYTKSKDFWLKEFSNNPQCQIFPAPENALDFSSSEMNYAIPAELISRIKALCHEKEITAASFFNTVNSIYFYKRFGVENFTIGVPIFNRTTADELNTIGLYMHLVPLVINVKNDSFIYNAKKIEDSQMNLLRHQSFTQHDIKKLLTENNIEATQLFDIVFDFQELPQNDDYKVKVPYGNALSVPIEMHIQTFDETNYNFKIRYRTTCFKEQEIQIMLKAIVALIENSLNNPDKNICEIEMISATEKEKILKDFNNTSVEYLRDKCIHELFEEQAERTPDKVALVASDKTLTYKELNEEANRIAHSLIEKGVGKGDVVGLMLPRKSCLLTALFGILKTGAAYLPIDMELPKERIEYMCQDTNAKLVVSEENIDSLLQVEDTSNPNTPMTNESLCYCIYTSGSTGQPKGVLARHRNVVNYISKNEHNIFGKIVKEDFESIVSISTCSFDIFVTETVATLVNGLRVVLADEQACRNQYALNRLLTREKGEFLQTTPTKLKVLTADPSQRGFLKNLKAILLGGEAMEESYLNELKKLTNAKIYNIYGVTEVPIWSAFADTDTFNGTITVGRGIANTQIYIVDKHMNPTPIGVMGELCIAGDSVSSGYLNRPELTEEKFVDNPFGNGKIYRTGDHAYWTEDGNIVFIGRKDFQVKIRGLRIELGEIESVLQAVEGIERAVVVVRKDEEERQLLCAFYTGEEKEAKELRTALSKNLPKYMIPHIFTYLEKMPMTASGKANRNALPEIDLENISTETEYVAAETREEKMLTESIEEVLKAEKVSIVDNFFDIGGDSLKSIELVSRLEAKGYTVNIKTIFEAKDIQSLAKEVKEKKEKEETITYESVIPATSAQMNVYTAQLIDGESTLYNISYIFKTESLDVDRFEKSINKLVERHESLRTHFENRSGNVVQVINDNAAIEIQKLESDNPADFIKPFNLGKTPLLRVGYYENTVMIDTHHIIADGTSSAIFFKELNELYMGRELKPTVQYGEFAVTDTYTEENEQYWLNVFKEEPTTLELPTDYQRPEKQSFKGTNKYTRIEKELERKILNKCKQLGITPYAYYMACYNILLSKFSNNEDICVGMPVSGRSSKYLNTMGMFVNTVVLRSNPDGEKTFKDFANEVKEKSLEAINHQKYPYQELTKKTNDKKSLCDVMFAYQSEEMTEIIFGDKKARVIPTPVSTSKYDLSFYVFPREEETVLMTEYCTDLYKEETINKFIEAYSIILEQCLEERKQIKDIAVLNEEEKKKVLVDFNDTASEYPKDKGVYELFEEQAEKTPDKPAVVFKNKKMTYSQLKYEVGECADRLCSLNIKAKDIVAVHLERSHELIVFQLAILKIGAIFLPVDKRFPINRIQQMCDNCDVSLLISDELDRTSADANVIQLDDFDLISPTNSATTVTNLGDCYIIYTSGSTGVPKGCLLTGKGLLNFCLNNNTLETLNNIENPIFACVNSASFDYFIAETLLPLTNGFTTVVLDDTESTMQDDFLEVVAKNKINVIMTTPTRLKIYFNDKYNCSALKNMACICTSGEPLTPDLLEKMYKKSPEAQVYNPIGPSECSVWDMGGRLERADGLDIHIGKPIANAQIYIVDKFLNPTPIGITGEICIAGDGVGSGYLNNPELTAEKFINNPFGEGKLYKTGDLAYWRTDGNICYVGRNDFQVKVRGLRIELGEIESELEKIDGVEQTVATVRKDNQDHQFICAFYTGKEKEAKEIRAILNTKLPKYMVPHIFVHLEEMPLTSSGKISRNNLPEVDLNNISTEAEYVAPETEEEKALAEAIEEVLGTERVSMEDNFFNVGGDSISAIYIVSVLEEMGYELHVADIMQQETLSNVARAMKSTLSKAIYDQYEVTGLIPYSPIMKAFINEQNTIPKDFVHICTVAVACKEVIVRKAIDILVSHHDMLRGTFTEDGIEILPSDERKVYSFKTITIEDTEKAKEYLNKTNPQGDKLVNVVFCKTEKETLVSIAVHHFLIDLISWEVLVKDLQTIIRQIEKEEKIELPAKTASFKLWSEKLREYGAIMPEENRAYWEEINNKLENAKSFCSNEEENEAEEYSYTFDKDISEKVINGANAAYGTRTNEILLTALGLAAGKLASGDVGIMVESHGRTELHKPIAVERTIGWFTSCYPVVINRNEIITEELINVKETMRRIPKNGVEYLLMTEKFHENTDILFNYYKTSFAEEKREDNRITFGGTSIFPGKINVNCFAIDGFVTVNISVPKCKHKPQIGEELGKEFQREIERIVDICTGTEEIVKTRSDFSDNSLTESELNELMDLFG